MPKTLAVWTYKGINVHPASPNTSGVKWWALSSAGQLKSDTKQGMRELINHVLRSAPSYPFHVSL